MKEQIREALDKATPRWHDNGNEIVSMNNPRVGIGGFLKEEDNHLAANSPTWLRWQNERIEQLEKAIKEAIEESRWGDAENSLGKVNRILNAALGREE